MARIGANINPSLGDVDYSGFLEANRIRSAALRDLGERIGEGITKYQENKAMTAALLSSIEGSTAANKEVLVALENAPDYISKAYNRLKENPNRNDALIINGYIDAFQTQQSQMTQKMLADAQARAAIAGADVAEGTVDSAISQAESAADQAETEAGIAAATAPDRIEQSSLASLQAGLGAEALELSNKAQELLNEKSRLEIKILEQTNANASANDIIFNQAIQLASQRSAQGNPFTQAELQQQMADAGYVFQPDFGDKLEPYVGEILISAEDKKAQQALVEKEASDIKQSFEDFALMNVEARKIIEKMGGSGIGGNLIDILNNPFGGGDQAGLFSTGWIRFGNDANELESRLNTILSIIGFNRLQKMRMDSPTGGALGQVSNIENKLLQSTQGALAGILGMGEREGKQALEDFMYNQARVVNRQYEYFKAKYGETEATKRTGFTADSIVAIQNQMDNYEKIFSNSANIVALGGKWRDTSRLVTQGVKPATQSGFYKEPTTSEIDRLFDTAQQLPTPAGFTNTGTPDNLSTQSSATVGDDFEVLGVEGE